MPRTRKPKKKPAKTVNFELIPFFAGMTNAQAVDAWQRGQRHHEPTEPYAILHDMINRYHPHLEDAKICLAWRMGWKHDKDNRLILGQCRKASDLDRELKEWDFVILLNSHVWHLSDFTIEKKRALIDHELMHAQVHVDDDGEVKKDNKGRTVYRIRKHDLEEFRDVVARHGFYKSDLAEFAKACIDRASTPLFPVNGSGRQPAAARATGPPPEDNSWRSVFLADLDIPTGIHSKLVDAGISTLGQLADFTTTGAPLTQVKGIGPAAVATMEAATTAYWEIRMRALVEGEAK